MAAVVVAPSTLMPRAGLHLLDFRFRFLYTLFMAKIEVDEGSKRFVSFAAQMANVTEGEIVRRLIASRSPAAEEPDLGHRGVSVFADYEGHRTRAMYFSPARVEIADGPLKGKSFKTPTGAARAVVRHYNPKVHDNRNGWNFWQIDNGGGPRLWLQSIRPGEHAG